jgi:putative ABC transport system permease protein
LFGWPMRKVAGVAGHLAQKNAVRNSRRTATTAAALMIGLTLVTTALVVGESVKASIGSTFEQSAKADYYLTDELDEVAFPAVLVGELRQSDVVAAATGFTHFDARVDGDVTGVVGFDFDQIDALLDLDVRAGGFEDTVDHPVVVSADEAEAIDAGLGDAINLEVANGSRVRTTIVGVFDDQTIVGEDYLFDTSVLVAAGVEPTAEWLAVSIADGAPPAAVQALVAGLSEQHPNAFIETPNEFRQRVEGMIDQVLTMVNVMVALAVVIALIGIANTLALSVFERTRELGLVRAVGMTRRQLRRMVRYEAALVATFGATLGVGLGLLFGFSAVSALPASFASGFSVPTAQLAIVMLVAASAGVVAAWLPARRASRLDILSAIAH